MVTRGELGSWGRALWESFPSGHGPGLLAFTLAHSAQHNRHSEYSGAVVERNHAGK